MILWNRGPHNNLAELGKCSVFFYKKPSTLFHNLCFNQGQTSHWQNADLNVFAEHFYCYRRQMSQRQTSQHNDKCQICICSLQYLQNISKTNLLPRTNDTTANTRFIFAKYFTIFNVTTNKRHNGKCQIYSYYLFFLFFYLFLYFFMDLKFLNLVTTKKRNNGKRQIYTQLQIISQSLLLPQTNVTTANIRVIMFYTIAEYFAIFIGTTEKRHNGKRQIYTLLQNILQSLLLPQTSVTTAKVRFIFVSYPKTDRC